MQQDLQTLPVATRQELLTTIEGANVVFPISFQSALLQQAVRDLAFDDVKDVKAWWDMVTLTGMDTGAEGHLSVPVTAIALDQKRER